MSTPLPTRGHAPTLELPQEDKVLRFTLMRDADKKTTPPDREWLWELASKLQKTLHVEDLVRIFSEHAVVKVKHDSVEFQDDDGSDPIRLGTQCEHSCSYKVRLPEEDLGTITLTRATPFSPHETTAIENIVLNLVYPLRNAMLYQRVLRAAARDRLTGLGNRATLDATLEREVASAFRHREPLTVIMLDVDNFKQINDAHGHIVGDRVLQSLAACISGCIRDSDIAFRYGGEEFVIVLSKTGLEGAAQLAERVRSRVEGMTIKTDDGLRLRVTVSLGLALLAEGDDSERLLEKADAALYQSKSGGRNRVSMHRTAAESGPAAPPESRAPAGN